MCFRSAKNLKLDLNSRLVVIFVLRLAKPLSETSKRKLVTHCNNLWFTSCPWSWIL